MRSLLRERYTIALRFDSTAVHPDHCCVLPYTENREAKHGCVTLHVKRMINSRLFKEASVRWGGGALY
jgi:hypothetical protein